MYYKGKGNHSVSELEQIIFELQEKEHFMNAPYIESCLNRLKEIENIVDANNQVYHHLAFIEMFLNGIKNNTKPELFTKDQLNFIISTLEEDTPDTTGKYNYENAQQIIKICTTALNEQKQG